MKHLKLTVILLLLAAAAVALAVGIWKRDSITTSLKERLERHRQEQVRRAEYRKWGEGRAAAELEGERKWQAGPMTPCGSFGGGSEPQVCIEHVGPDTVPIGTPVAYRVRWRNLPQGAYIRVWSRNAAAAGQRWKYMGAYGAIAAAALGGTSEGDARLTWDGRGIYCAPSDLPMMCDSGEVGRYVLRAAVMTGSDPFWPSWPPMKPVPVTNHAQSETRAFVLDGLPQPVTRQGSFRSYPANRDIVEAIKGALPSGALGTDWYVERRIERLGPWAEAGSSYCAGLDLDSPLTGSVKVCFPRSRRDSNGIALRPGDIGATSNARLADGIMRAEDAKAKASAYAIAMTGGRATFSSYPSEEAMVRALYPDPKKYDGGYQHLRNAARDAKLTYVEVNQPYPSFRDDPGGSWWLVDMSLWIGTIDGPIVQDWGRIALRVDHDGYVCRVDRTGERVGEGRDQREIYSDCRPGSRRRIQD
jgi:hypothetical protein